MHLLERILLLESVWYLENAIQTALDNPTLWSKSNEWNHFVMEQHFNNCKPFYLTVHYEKDMQQ